MPVEVIGFRFGLPVEVLPPGSMVVEAVTWLKPGRAIVEETAKRPIRSGVIAYRACAVGKKLV